MMKHAFFMGRVLLMSGVLCALLGYYNPALSELLNNGMAQYKAGNYAQAAKILESSLKQNASAEGLFYLGMAYTHLNRFDEARDAFDRVLQMSVPASKLAVMARNNINFVTKQQITLASNSGKAAQVLSASLSRSSKDNYLTYVLYGGKVVHFATNRMPLKVFISDGRGVPSWNSGMKEAVTYAMKTWRAATHNRVYFAQVFNEANADIIVHWQKNFSDGVLGVSPLQTVGNAIVQSDVNLASYYPDTNAPIPLEGLKAIAVHELGHAIGLRGHSPNPDDIMFYSATRRQNTLSQRDINTIGMLYKLEADVQNNDSASTAATKRYYALYEQGYKAQTSGHPSEAMAAYRQALQISPQKMEAKFNLGALLINEGARLERSSQYDEARQKFIEARRMFAEISQMPNAPPGTRENFAVADKNLNIVNQALNP
jgi:tetratricopeptide (TPR) repeat protein